MLMTWTGVVAVEMEKSRKLKYLGKSSVVSAPVFPATPEAEAGDHLSPEDGGQPGQHRQHVKANKQTKKARHW
jgi:hypothetical protein